MRYRLDTKNKAYATFLAIWCRATPRVFNCGAPWEPLISVLSLEINFRPRYSDNELGMNPPFEKSGERENGCESG